MRAEELLAAALRVDAAAPWPAGSDSHFETRVVDAAREHGVAALVAGSAAIAGWPEQVQRAFAALRREEVVIEAIRRRLLQELFAAFRRANIRCLVVKGAHLAYTHYPQPWMRPRVDTDLLIDAGDRDVADRTLRSLGYQPASQVSGALVSHQLQYERLDKSGLADTIDLHWKITNPHLFADALTFDELMSSSRTVPELDAAAPSNVHALWLACVHRVAHHLNSGLLIWLYDIHVLAGALNVHEREQFLELARLTRVRTICAAGLNNAELRFGVRHEAGWHRSLATGSEQEVEPSAAFLRPGFRRIDILLSDLRCVPGWAGKVRLVREHLFPPAAYVRAQYGPNTPLLVAYAGRVVTGVAKWFRSS